MGGEGDDRGWDGWMASLTWWTWVWASLNSEIISHKFESWVVVVELLSHVRLFVTPWTAACQAFPSFTVLCSNSCPLSQWGHPIILSSVTFFSSCPQSFPASSESFPVSQFFASSGQSIGVSASVLPMNIQDWFPLGWAGWISLQSRELSRVLSNTTVQKHQFFGAQPSLWSNSHIHTWLLEKPAGEGNGNPLQFSCLRNPIDRGLWQVTVHAVSKQLDTT